ncbi:ABC transporter ATP-binding protein [Pelagicoccus sp. SDUM812002]|uniref:ABC transporter ATP-binding protein n=1 Tax=Pelagicoccus sp. SDUM812002 TaxID=3041266 RepID=UPI00280D884F|nr:ABC transporter ATP-binding protein [Pelagicoccus sp. SDUM812002]MDQ8184061.1 ABC transporter ATP-binding protein [Pelagicoccus sp. SDUM812002]
MLNSNVIETRGLTKRYGAQTVLDGLDLSLPAGAIGLLGPNGAGKSTFIKCLLQLEEKDGGKVSLLGNDIDTLGRETRRRIGYAPEQDCHIPGMVGCEYVTYCGELSGMPFEAARQRAHEMLDFVGMGQERYRKVDTYSTGMKQRIKIAQALVHDPDLVFLDEPTNGLDPKGQSLILELIERIWKESGISVVLSSHLLHDVDRICDRIVIIAQGRIVAHDTLSALKGRRRPEAEVVAADDTESLLGLFRAQGWACSVLNNGNIKVVHGQPSLNPLIDLMREAGISPLEVKESPNALSELFLQSLEKERVPA